MKGAKKAAAGGSKGKGKINPRKKPKKGAKKLASDSGDKKEDDKDLDKTKSDTQPCKFSGFEPVIECCQSPVNPTLCRGCGTSVDTTVSSIPHGADWKVSFPIQ